MTLVLTFVTPHYVLQVSDRRLTRLGDPWDHASNKVVLFLAKDAIVSIAYSGLAYVDGLPTDHWMAQQLWGEAIEEPDEHTIMSVLKSPPKKDWPDLGTALARLRGETSLAFGRLPVNVRPRHQIVVAGWQSRKGRPHPIAYEIANGRERSQRHAFSCAGTARRWHWERLDQSGRRVTPWRLSYIPDQNPLSGFELNQLGQTLADAMLSPDGCRQIMINAIRTAAKRSSVVGPDCLCVLLPLPTRGVVQVSYDSVLVSRATITAGSHSASTSVTVSPWILSSSCMVPPQISMGACSMAMGSFRVDVAAPQNSGGPVFVDGRRILGFTAAQERKRWGRSR